MNLIIIAAVVAVCGAAKLDRTYLPPASSKTAGGSPGSLQTPFAGNSFNDASNFPKGSFTNEFQGVVVDAAAAGTRASGEGETGLGGPRISYGSTDSKVGDAAFRDAPNFRPFPGQETNGQSQEGDGQTASSQVSPQDFNQNRFAPRVESKPERAQAAFDRVANTLRFENEVGPDSYQYAYETDNGISAEENGVITDGVQAQGRYSYTGDDGQVYSVTYVADKDGYQPKGDHLPTPPPIPEEILKALEKNAQDEAAGVIDDGSYDAQKYNAGADYAESDSGNTEYNDRQTPKFGKRPESDATGSGSFINQNNQAFRPSPNALPEQPISSEEQASNNNFGNIGQSSQPTRGPANANNFGSRKEYLPPTNGFNQNRRQQRPFAAPGANAPQFNRFNGNSQSFGPNGNSETQNTQQSQSSSSFGRPGSNRLDVLAQGASKETPVETNQFVSTSNNNFAQNGQASQNSGNSFGSRAEYLPPVRESNGRPQGLRPQRPTTSAEDATTPSFNAFSQSSGSFQSNNVGNVQPSPSQFGSGSQSAGQFSGFQQKPQTFGNRLSQNRFQSSQSGNNQPEEGQSEASISSIDSQRPTSQPSIELTTPLESNEQPESITSGSSNSINGFNSQTNSRRPTPQFGSQSNGQFFGSSRPINQQSVSQKQVSSFSSQNQFNRPSFSLNQQSSEERPAENIPDANDAQFAPSTVRPSFGQTQGSDDSYYYRQPSKPFNTPSGSRFPAASPSQFERINQQSSQGSGQFISESQESSSQPQNNFNRVTIKYPEPPTLAPATPTVSFDQFQGTTNAAQYTEAAISPFQPLNQGSTKYPRPPTLAPTAPTTQFSGITETISSIPTVLSNIFASKPTFQQSSQFNYQSQSQSLPQAQDTESNQAVSQENSFPQVATQQYNGEIYDYSKPPQGLPAPAQKEPAQNIAESQPTRSQFDATQGSSNVQEYTQQPTRPTFGARPQFGSQTRPQFGSQFSSQEQPVQDSRPQFNAQSFEGSQPNQDRNVGAQNNRSKCCQSLDARLQSYRGVTQGSTGPAPTQSQFGAQFQGSTAQTVSQSSGRGEVFGGPRQPPSFNQETGYHY